MGSGFSKMKKQAKQMQEQMQQMQQEMESLVVEGTAGNGLVKIKLNGKKELKNLSIDPKCVDPEDIEGLEDLISAAYEDAFNQIEAKQSSPMPGMGFPF